jgi:hypothetical protein
MSEYLVDAHAVALKKSTRSITSAMQGTGFRRDKDRSKSDKDAPYQFAFPIMLKPKLIP